MKYGLPEIVDKKNTKLNISAVGLQCKGFLLIGILLLVFQSVSAQAIRVAVAANAQFVVKKIAQEYQQKTGVKIEVIGGASGKLATQISNGAPYDIFLSADMQFAENVYKNGFALNKPQVYAMGSLIVCSASGQNLKIWKQLLAKPGAGKVAIANPDVAPYGKAAQQALKKMKLYDAASSKLVFAESISQVNTYVLKGAVAIGFTTESLVYETSMPRNFSWQRIDTRTYDPIKQAGVLLKHAQTADLANTQKFFNYLFSAPAQKIFKQYGYKTI